jgi:hypothetical protein
VLDPCSSRTRRMSRTKSTLCRNRRMSLTKSSFVRAPAMLDRLLECNRHFCRNRRMSRTKSSFFCARAVLVLMLVLMSVFINLSLDRSPLLVADLCLICARRMFGTKSSLFRAQAVLDGCLERNRNFRRNRRISFAKLSLFRARAVLVLMLRLAFIHFWLGGGVVVVTRTVIK